MAAMGRSPSREIERTGAETVAAMMRGAEQAAQVAPWAEYIQSLEVTWLDLSPEERERRMAARLETAWIAYGFEPPLTVTRVRSADGRTVAVRGAECWFEGPGHSNWAYVLVNGQPRIPGPDSTVPEGTGWYCWLDLDGRIDGYWRDDTANDVRP